MPFTGNVITISGVQYPYSEAVSIGAGNTQTITHALGHIPQVVVLDSSSVEVDVQITHDETTKNSFIIDPGGVALTGTVYYT